MGSQIKELAEKSFAKEIGDGVTLVTFWAPWCHACHAVLPVIEQIAEKSEDKVKFYKTNVVDNPTLSSRYGVMSLPNILIFKKGKIKEQIIGSATKKSIEEKLEKVAK